jgi:hypothetical protein
MGYVILAVVAVAAVAALVFFGIKQRGRAEKTRVTSVPAIRPSGQPGAPPSTITANWLVGESGPVKGKTYHMGMRTVTIGRGEGCFVQIESPSCLRQHCQIRPTEKGPLLTDLRSETGTFVNGRRVKNRTLEEGDLIKIEDCELRYHKTGFFGRDRASQPPEQGPSSDLPEDD